MPGRELARRVIAVAVMLGLGALTVLALVHGQPVAVPAAAPGSSRVAASSAADGAAVDVLLAARSRAVLDDDRAAWAGTLAPAAAQVQGGVFDRLRVLEPVAWTYARTGTPTGVGPTRTRVDVRLTYQLADGSPRVTRAQTLILDEGRVLTSAPATAPDLWDLAPVVRRDVATATGTVDARCVIVAAAGSEAAATTAKQVAGLCPASVGVAQKAVHPRGGAPAPVTLVVPPDVAGLAALLGRADGAGLDRTAAVTVGPPHRPAEAVFVNPAAFGQLRAVGRRVVLTHELVHVATRADDTADVPTWLDEGLADEIAYAATELDPQTIAGPVLDQARGGRFPTRLPATADFDATGSAPELAYAQAWSAADTIAAEAGVAGLVRVHRLVGTGTSLDAALQRVLGTGTAGFVSMWQQHLGRQIQNGNP